jgi:hypothetical protein
LLIRNKSEGRGAGHEVFVAEVDIHEAGRAAKIERLGAIFLRYGLVVAIGWIAAMKVTEYEAKGIQPLIAHSHS